MKEIHAGVHLAVGAIRSMPSPYCCDGPPPLIVHSCYHKTGTHWLKKVLLSVKRKFGLPFRVFENAEPVFTDGILFDGHSKLKLENVPDAIVSHLIRDPRDIVVSGYHYHLWTPERWVRKPNPALNGKSYQQYLNSVDRETGILAEITRCKELFDRMGSWPYGRTNVLELKYENLICDIEEGFRSLFRHYGFNECAVWQCVEIAIENSFLRKTNRGLGDVLEGTVTRSGMPGQWRECFSEEIKNHFRTVSGNLLQTLAYEQNDDW